MLNHSYLSRNDVRHWSWSPPKQRVLSGEQRVPLSPEWMRVKSSVSHRKPRHITISSSDLIWGKSVKLCLCPLPQTSNILLLAIQERKLPERTVSLQTTCSLTRQRRPCVIWYGSDFSHFLEVAENAQRFAIKDKQSFTCLFSVKYLMWFKVKDCFSGQLWNHSQHILRNM